MGGLSPDARLTWVVEAPFFKGGFCVRIVLTVLYLVECSVALAPVPSRALSACLGVPLSLKFWRELDWLNLWVKVSAKAWFLRRRVYRVGSWVDPAVA